MIGKGPDDPAIGYPEHDHHKKVGDLASSVRLYNSVVHRYFLKHR